ncbi:MAG: cardiolipin synthase ClsB [Betaproteobacteria bacterium]|jgi:cardiolipin synthase|nr:MAG: cardiolipin synthase ClsB [Betaproteobacteria bacterium]
MPQSTRTLVPPAPVDERALPEQFWHLLPRAVFSGGNQLRLLRGGEALFPAMLDAIREARHEIWLASYIFNDDPTALAIARALGDAARRGVQVKVVLDGFGCNATLPVLQQMLCESGVFVAVFRPLHRWWNWLQPGQLRRLHQKMCVVDGDVAFVGGINLIDDRYDLTHGWGDTPRLDFAVELRGPTVGPVEQATRALWMRAQLGRDLREEVAALARSAEPLARVRRLLRRLRMPRGSGLQASAGPLPPMLAAFVLRDNLRQRRTIERSYIDAIRSAERRVYLASPYFYPGSAFRRALRRAARRGVKVHLLLQGKIDYRFAALAARVMYDELLASGVRIFEYTPAFLHAKVAVIDDDWATVGSSNIDPLSLLLNLEANVIVSDARFSAELAQQFDEAFAQSIEIDRGLKAPRSLAGVLRRGLVAWCAYVYLRIAGTTGRY